MASLTYPGPRATALQVTVHSGRELVDSEWFGKTSPYVKIFLGPIKRKSQKKKGVKPVWEEAFNFTYNNEPNLRFQIWDKDMFSDDYMGLNDLPLLPILQQPDRKFHGEIALTHKKGRPAGHLRVTIQFWPQNLKSESPAPAPSPAQPVQPQVQPQPVAQPQMAPYYPPPPSPVAASQPYYPPPAQQQAPATVVVVGQQQPPRYPPQYPPAGYQQQQYPPQAGYPPQQHPPPAGYAQGYPPQTGYPPQACPPQGYPPQQGYQFQQGYPPQQGYPTQPYNPYQQQYR